mmetsp:Transcript_123311/g.237738  ORF Transcript_123311/g.237738 Transcript_123311/m.237738 type:complete len:241 (-) Transcript_123311:216-938(-)
MSALSCMTGTMESANVRLAEWTCTETSHVTCFCFSASIFCCHSCRVFSCSPSLPTICLATCFAARLNLLSPVSAAAVGGGAFCGCGTAASLLGMTTEASCMGVASKIESACGASMAVIFFTSTPTFTICASSVPLNSMSTCTGTRFIMSKYSPRSDSALSTVSSRSSDRFQVNSSAGVVVLSFSPPRLNLAVPKPSIGTFRMGDKILRFRSILSGISWKSLAPTSFIFSLFASTIWTVLS